jgi:hypothetical protein
MHSNGNSFGECQASIQESTERECPLFRRLLQAAEDRR